MTLLYLYIAFMVYVAIGFFVMYIKTKELDEDRLYHSVIQSLFVIALWPMFLFKKL